MLRALDVSHACAPRSCVTDANMDLQVTVQSTGDEQRVRLTAQHPGRLLLHWGVIGGQGYKEGWRLPGDAARPEGTVAYKNRALQTPFRQPADKSLVPVLASGQCWCRTCTVANAIAWHRAKQPRVLQGCGWRGSGAGD
jgi:hypothetical protein